MTFQKLSISILVLAAAGLPVSATTIVYCSSGCGVNTLTAFDNAAAAESLFFPNAPILFATAGLSADTTTYTDSVSSTQFFDFNGTGTAIDSNGFISPISGGLKIFTQGDQLKITLPSGVFAFGANIQESATTHGGVCIEQTCDGTVTFSSPTDTEFVGVVSTTPITTVWLVPPNNAKLTVSNFEIGEQAADPPPDTPEIATMIMIGTGLISIGAMRRRRQIAC